MYYSLEDLKSSKCAQVTDGLKDTQPKATEAAVAIPRHKNV